MAAPVDPQSPQAVWDYWSSAVLAGIGAPQTANNLDILKRWANKENTAARYNYLATTQKASGSVNFNTLSGGSGVQSYASPQTSVQATVQTLQNYPNVVAMFRGNVAGPQWSPAARYELDTWAHGPSGVHDGAYSSFLGGSGGSTPSRAFAGGGGTSGNPISDQINSALTGALAGVVGPAEQSLGKAVKRYAYLAAGTILILAGLGLLAMLLVRGPGAAVAETAAQVTPQGRALRVIQGGLGGNRQTVKQELSPEAQRAVREAKAGRGAKLSPEVKEELRRSQSR